MRRRDFIAGLGGAAVVGTCGAWAQQAVMPVIGFLANTSRDGGENLLAAARRGLGEAGYADGRQILIETRWADDKDDRREGQNPQFEFRSAEGSTTRLPGLAAELVHLKVDAIIPYPSPAVAAVKQATREIPIVMFGAGDPVGTGLVSSLARPGGNITGTSSTTAELGSKALEVVRELIPSVRRVAVLANATDPFTKSFLEQMNLGGQVLGLETQIILVNGPNELDPAFAAMKKKSADAVVVQPSLPRTRIAELALRHRVPAVAPTAAFAMEGGLAAYAANQTEMARRTVATIDKILKGSKPADLPVEKPTKFQLAINIKTARALGLTVPATLLARADEVIE